MKTLFLLSGFLTSGCTVIGSAFVERDLPDGRAVAKVEMHFTPPVSRHAPWREEPQELTPPSRAPDASNGTSEVKQPAARGCSLEDVAAAPVGQLVRLERKRQRRHQ
jgi:hypothetical protein